MSQQAHNEEEKRERENELSICVSLGHAPSSHKTRVESDGILPSGSAPARCHPGAVGNHGRRSSAMGGADLFPDEPEQLSEALRRRAPSSYR